ncbi:hypothetical protein ACQKCU_20375 [Heyndrickxia sporothermodurans]
MFNRSFFSLWIGILGCSILIVLYLFGPYLPFVDEKATEHKVIMEENSDISLPPFPPSSRFPLGSDNKGRDLLSMLVIGTKETLETVVIVTGLTFLIGIPLGIGSAHLRILRVILKGWNYLFSRIPLLFFLIILATIPIFIFSPNRPLWMMGFLVLLEVGKVADVVGKSVQAIQQSTYYEAAIISGTKIFGLWRWYYLPNCYAGWVSYFIQHMGSILFLLGQLGIFNIFLSQTIAQTIENSPLYAIENSSLIWPMYLNNIIVDSHTGPWILMYTSLFITFAMFSLNALGAGILDLELSKVNGLKKIKANSAFRFKKLLINKKSKSNHKVNL